MTDSSTSLSLVRRMRADPAKVYAALTRPELMLRWWGPDAGPTLSAEADVRNGGRFSIVFQTTDGQTHNPTGVYLEVEPERRLAFTWEWPGAPEKESRVTIVLRPTTEGTELTLTHVRLPDLSARHSHERGWTGLFDKLLTFSEETA